MPLYVEPGYVEPGYVEGDDAVATPESTRPDASKRLLLWEDLPRRTTRMLGDYADDRDLAEVYGDLSNSPFPLIRLGPKRYFASEGAITMLQVFTDKQVTLAWQQALETDDDGNAWTIVRFEAPIPEAVAVSATAIGRRHPDTGVLLENPADVAERIFRIAGRDDDLSLLRAECSRLGIRIAGRIAGMRPIKEHIDEVMQSVGAIWSPGMARLYPSADTPLAIFDLDKSEVENLSVSAAVVDAADVLRLSFDRSDASGKPRQYIEFTASPQRNRGKEVEVVYPLLRIAANGEAVGRPVAQRLAGARYDIEFDSSNRRIKPGMYVRPVAHPEWQLPDDDPIVMVLKVERGRAAVHVWGETMLGDLPTITVTAHSIALPDTVQAGLDVSVRDGVATFTATDEDGRAIPGARVSLDGGEAKTTDAQGRVRFALKVGAEGALHEVVFEAPGFTALTLQVTL